MTPALTTNSLPDGWNGRGSECDPGINPTCGASTGSLLSNPWLWLLGGVLVLAFATSSNDGARRSR